jgi:hypothetical protein
VTGLSGSKKTLILHELATRFQQSIINIVERISGTVPNEDAKLLMWHDWAQAWKGEA